MDSSDLLNNLASLIRSHEEWRASCLNLIASENVSSEAVRQCLHCDLIHRYGNYEGRDLKARSLCGNRYVAQVEQLVDELVRDVFGVAHTELRTLSGHLAGVAVIMGLLKPGAKIMELGKADGGGGHCMAGRMFAGDLMNLQVVDLPFRVDIYNIDVGRTLEMIRGDPPDMIILGSSNFLFPHPVRELAEVLADYPETIMAYDASHVFGLIAGQTFQQPLAEGSHLMFGSTHKTLPGPQGGMVIGNSRQLIERVSRATYPGLVTNHHLARLPALGVALLELKQWGQTYATQTIKNAQTLAHEIHQRGVPAVATRIGYTQSHTLLLQVGEYGQAAEVAARLEAVNIITSPVVLPMALGREGLRLGVQEITRMGATLDHMPAIAGVIADAILGRRNMSQILSEAQMLARMFQKMSFCWDDPQAIVS